MYAKTLQTNTVTTPQQVFNAYEAKKKGSPDYASYNIFQQLSYILTHGTTPQQIVNEAGNEFNQNITNTLKPVNDVLGHLTNQYFWLNVGGMIFALILIFIAIQFLLKSELLSQVNKVSKAV
jgi:hypothetical protein